MATASTTLAQALGECMLFWARHSETRSCYCELPVLRYKVVYVIKGKIVEVVLGCAKTWAAWRTTLLDLSRLLSMLCDFQRCLRNAQVVVEWMRLGV